MYIYLSEGSNVGTRKQDGYWDLPRALEGGVGAFFCSVYIPEEYYPSRFETKQAFRRVEHALEQLELNRDVVHLALNADDITRIRAKGKMAAVLDMRGATIFNSICARAKSRSISLVRGAIQLLGGWSR